MRANKVHNEIKTGKITPRAREPCEMCRGEMRSSLGVVKLGILRLRLSKGWTHTGVGSSGAVVSCLGGDGVHTPPYIFGECTDVGDISTGKHYVFLRNCDWTGLYIFA